MATSIIKDHHLLTRNLKLNGNYLSNDGQDEGISIDDGGQVKLSQGNNDTSLWIDHNYDDTSTNEDIVSVKIDYDNSASSSSNYTEVALDINALHNTSTGGVSTMYGQKIYARNKEYYQANKEKINSRHREYNQANKEELNAYRNEYNKINKEKVISYRKEYHQANKEKINLCRKINWLKTYRKTKKKRKKQLGSSKEH